MENKDMRKTPLKHYICIHKDRDRVGLNDWLFMLNTNNSEQSSIPQKYMVVSGMHL